MDPLSLSASIVAVLQMTGKLLSYLNDVRNATKDQAQLAVEASNIYGLLTSLRFRVEQSNAHDPWFLAVHKLAMENGPLDQAKEALERLVSKVEPFQGIQRLGRQLMWKFDKSEMRDIVNKIERIKTLVNIALTDDLLTLSQAINKDLCAMGKEVSTVSKGVMALRDGQQTISEDVSNISVGVTALNTGQQEEERRKVENWLSPIDFRYRHQEILKGAQAGTRQWLFDSREFRSWVDADQGTLWCPGIPGAGKTVTSSIIIDRLQSEYQNKNVAVTCLSCNYRDRASQSAEIFMANLVKQIVQQKQTVSTELTVRYKDRERGRPTFAELAALFSQEIGHFSKVFVVIDALDETSEHEDIRRLVLSELQNLPVNLLVTSRYEKSIEQRLEKAERLEIVATAADVQTYVKARIPFEHLLARHVRADPTLEETIVNKIVEKSQGMFLLARFHVDSLVTKTKRKDVRKALETLPPELDQSYEQTMARLKGQGKDYSELAMRVLLWVCNSVRPLSPVELQYAIAVQPGMTELDDEDLDDQDLMTSVCAGLIVLDAETNTLRFVHYTAQEYFDRNKETLFGDAHAKIAMGCITYLSLNIFTHADFSVPANDPLEHDKEFRRYPLTYYAVSTWAYHARMTQDKALMDTLLSFLNRKTNIDRAIRLEPQLGGYSRRAAEQPSAIHLAAMYGLRHATQRLLDEGTLADLRDSHGHTPLFFAAMMGEADVVKLLLATDDVDINAQTEPSYSMTPLYVAADGGHLEVLRTLLQDGADVNLRCWNGTALNCAVRSRNAISTELLLEAGADPDSQNRKGNPVIFELSKVLEMCDPRPAKQIVELLHKHGANLKARDSSQRTLLHVAAEACNLEAVRMLLAEGLDPDIVDKLGQKPLHKVLDSLPPPYSKSLKERDEFYARREAIVRLLSNSRSRLDSNEHSRQTPLLNASWEQPQFLFGQGPDPKELKHGICATFEPTSDLEEKAQLPWIRRPYPGFSFRHEKTVNVQDGLFELE